MTMTKYALLFLLILVVFETQAVDYCRRFELIFQSKITQQIKSGVPFELVSLVSQNGVLLCKKTLYVKYDLWEENITLKINDLIYKKFPFKNSIEIFCSEIKCQNEKTKSDLTFTVQVLLNPIWEGKLRKTFQARTTSGYKLYTIDWDHLTANLPKEVEIFREEVIY